MVPRARDAWPTSQIGQKPACALTAPATAHVAGRALLREMFDAAVAAAQPARCVPPHLPPPPRGRMIVIGAGKASAAMARAVEEHWPGAARRARRHPLRLRGAVRARSRSSRRRIRCPDEAGLAAAKRMLAMVRGLTADDLVLCLISGGGSALLPLPADGPHARGQAGVNRALLQVGRDDRRDELRAPAPVGDQGRAARRGLPSGARW